jgi:hypothetical protein
MVSYTNLKPGKYKFTVMAESSDEIRSAVSDTLIIEQKPFYYQRPIFWIVIVLIVILGISGGVVLRFRHMEKIQKQLEKMVEAKTEDLEHEKDNSERLLLNILPQGVAKRLTENKDAGVSVDTPPVPPGSCPAHWHRWESGSGRCSWHRAFAPPSCDALTSSVLLMVFPLQCWS